VEKVKKRSKKMPKTRPPYPPEFREQILELVKAGRSPVELAQEFEPTAQTIRNWMRQAELDAGERQDGLSSPEREELARLRRENKQLRLERKSRGLDRGSKEHCLGDRRGTAKIYAFVKAHQADYPIATICRVVGVSTSGHYAWKKRGPSTRDREDQVLTQKIRQILYTKSIENPQGTPR
jgi:transposase